MDKPTKKRSNYNAGILNSLRSKYGYTLRYIRMCLNGERVGEMADIIKKEYKALDFASKEAIENKANELKSTI